MNARFKPWLDELVAVIALGWPIVFTNLAINFMTTTDVMMMGWLSPQALGSVSLGFNVYTPLMLFCVGAVGAAAPLAAARIGANARDRDGVRRVAQHAFLLALGLCLPIWALLWNAEALLRAIGEPPELAALAGRYMHGLQWALAPTLLFNAARGVFAALERTRPILIAALVGVGCNALSNYAIGLGHFGFPQLGVLGSGLSTTISQVVMLGVLVFYAWLDERIRAAKLLARPFRFDPRALADLWRLGAPIGLSITVEIGLFAAAALAMGLISQDAIEAHAIVIQIAATTFMVPLGLGQAASVRVGNAFGARDRARVSRAGWSAFAATMAFVTLSAAIMFAFPHQLIAPFLGGGDVAARAGVIALALSFLKVAAWFQLFDGAQAALVNMLRGLHDSRIPALIATAGYWAIGAPIGFALGFGTKLQGLGLWIGLAIGLAAVSLMLFLRWRLRERAGFF